MIDGEGEVAESRGGTARGQSEVHKLLAEVRSRGAVRDVLQRGIPNQVIHKLRRIRTSE